MKVNEKGKIFIVGTGPGDVKDMTIRAYETLKNADAIVGYSSYVDLIKPHFPDKVFYSSGMKKEIERCETALKIAHTGKNTALISDGDSGIYGMAGLMLEVIAKAKSEAEVEIVPGVTAATAAAAALGAPLMNDFAVISLSDCLCSIEKIMDRVEKAAQADFVICFYNPRSTKREHHLRNALDIIGKYRGGETPAAVISDARRDDEKYIVTRLDSFECGDVNMKSMVIIGNSETYIKDGRMITPRGYRI